MSSGLDFSRAVQRLVRVRVGSGGGEGEGRVLEGTLQHKVYMVSDLQ